MAQSRRYFEHNMWLLSEMKVNITRESAKMVKGMQAVRYGPNRRVNLHTVDESARLMANSLFNLLDREANL
jgi:hypothetical protein